VERGGLEEGQTSLGLPCEIRAYGEITKRVCEDRTINPHLHLSLYTIAMLYTEK